MSIQIDLVHSQCCSISSNRPECVCYVNTDIRNTVQSMRSNYLNANCPYTVLEFSFSNFNTSFAILFEFYRGETHSRGISIGTWKHFYAGDDALHRRTRQFLTNTQISLYVPIG